LDSYLQTPKAVYESGVTGFHLVRELRELGVDCIVGAVSKMHKPASDKRKKNDRNDAEFLARQLMAHNIVEVFVPDVETEGARNLSRVLEGLRDDLTRAKHRLTHILFVGVTFGTNTLKMAREKAHGHVLTGNGYVKLNFQIQLHKNRLISIFLR
jgi:Transposase and inactivated derivatives